MSILATILLGIVQGLTEFLPISSTGHLILMERLFDIQNSFEFDVLLNIGTLAALVLYYRATIAEIIRRVFRGHDLALLSVIVVATIPAIVIGYLFADQIENKLQSAWVVVVMLILVGIVMVAYKPSGKKKAEDLPLVGAIKIGFAQCIALIPGTSRSGVTILAGEQQGLGAVEAARFSFLLAIPTISGATLKVALSSDGRAYLADNLHLVIIGNIASFIAGVFAVHFLIKLLGTSGLKPFGWYRIGLGVVLAVLLFAKLI